ncbi:MAG: porin [Candidatus Omnitrophica bacterium]|nr:porin [Candidatus Omnitrophota bacterium]
MRVVHVTANENFIVTIMEGNIMNKRRPFLIYFVMLVFLMSSTAFAEVNEVMALKNEIKALSDRLMVLEKQLAMREKGPSRELYVPSPEEGREPGGFLRAAEDIQFGGYVDAQWNNHFRQPATASSAAASTVPLRVFDSNDGSFSLNAAELYFEKAAQEPGDAGFRVDVVFGQDASVVNGDGDGDVVDLEQAYVEYNVPTPFFAESEIFPEMVNLKAGRFATLAGMEVIEAPDNWNISRSVMFGFSLPFIHTGIRSNFGLFNDFLDVYFGLNNGWDNPIDNNSFKTLESAVGYEPIDGVSVFHALYWGGEVDDTVAGKRWLLTHVVNWDVTDRLSIAGNVDYGVQHDIQDPGSALPRTNDGDWWGFAGYARYQITNKLALAYRAEIFRDDALFRTGLTDTVFGQTVTAEYKLSDRLIARAEFRHDKANDDSIFPGAHSAQTNIAAQMIYLI